MARYRIGATMNRATALGNRAGVFFQSLLPHKKNCGFVRNADFGCATATRRTTVGGAKRSVPTRQRPTWGTSDVGTLRFAHPTRNGQLLINGAMILSISSIDMEPGWRSPLMKNVGVESTLNFCEPRSRICWTF